MFCNVFFEENTWGLIGTPGFSKMDEFSENFQTASGVTPPFPKILCFFPLKITKKNLQQHFLDRKWPAPLWKFSENLSIFENPGVPYLETLAALLT